MLSLILERCRYNILFECLQNYVAKSTQDENEIHSWLCSSAKFWMHACELLPSMNSFGHLIIWCCIKTSATRSSSCIKHWCSHRKQDIDDILWLMRRRVHKTTIYYKDDQGSSSELWIRWRMSKDRIGRIEYRRKPDLAI